MKLNQTVEDVLLLSDSKKTHFRKYSQEVNPSMVVPSDKYEDLIYDDIKKNNLANVWGMKSDNKIIMVVEVLLDEFKK